MLNSYELAQKHIELLFTDVEAWSEYIHQDMVWEVPFLKETGRRTEMQGLDTILTFLGNVPWKNLRFGDCTFYSVDSGNKAFIEAPTFGESPDDKLYDQMMCILIESDAGKITRIREYFDPLRIGAALNVDMNMGGYVDAIIKAVTDLNEGK